MMNILDEFVVFLALTRHLYQDLLGLVVWFLFMTIAFLLKLFLLLLKHARSLLFDLWTCLFLFNLTFLRRRNLLPLTCRLELEHCAFIKSQRCDWGLFPVMLLYRRLRWITRLLHQTRFEFWEIRFFLSTLRAFDLVTNFIQLLLDCLFSTP